MEELSRGEIIELILPGLGVAASIAIGSPELALIFALQEARLADLKLNPKMGRKPYFVRMLEHSAKMSGVPLYDEPYNGLKNGSGYKENNIKASETRNPIKSYKTD